MTRETIQELLREIKELESQRGTITSKIFDLKEKLLPHSYEIEEEVIDLEQHGIASNYYFISKIYKAIGTTWYVEEDAIMDAWNHYKEICNKKWNI